MENSKIEWTHHTANLWIGCTEVHEGCDNCYARVLNKRWGHDNWGKDVPRREVKSICANLVKMQNAAKEADAIHRVFVGSMMDIFEKSMPLVDSKGNMVNVMDLNGVPVSCNTGALREKLFERISNNWYPNLMFLFLTKRPSNINKYIPERWKTEPPHNVMFGTSPVNQETANKLIPQLLQVNGKRFLSVEPQLDSISIQGFLFNGGIDWVIQGGESGHHKRPFDLWWAYYLKNQCEKTGVPYFFKQIDKIKPIPEDLMIRQFPKY